MNRTVHFGRSWRQGLERNQQVGRHLLNARVPRGKEGVGQSSCYHRDRSNSIGRHDRRPGLSSAGFALKQRLFE